MSGVRYKEPPRAQTALGVLLPGAALAFYDEGTLDPLPVFADPHLRIPLPNPMHADFAARFTQFYLDETLTYRAILTSEGDEIFDLDPLVEFPDALDDPRDDSGAAMPFAVRTFWLGETTELGAIYADELLATPVDNPQVANVDGEFAPVFIDNVYGQRVRLTTRDGVLVYDRLYLLGAPPESLVVVPDVVGELQADGEDDIEAAGLEVGDITSEFSVTIPEGDISAQAPPGGSLAVLGDEVSIVISLGPPEGDCDSHFDEVALLLTCSGADGSTTFTDLSAYVHVVTPVNTAAVTDDETIFGENMLGLAGDGSYLSMPMSPQLDLSKCVRWTVELFFNCANVGDANKVLYGCRDATNESGITIGINPASGIIAVQLFGTGGTTFNSSFTPVADTNYHLALVSNGSSMTLYVDGVALNSGSIAPPHTTFGTAELRLGGEIFSFILGTFNGRMANVRVTRGVARYTADFEPPAAPFATQQCDCDPYWGGVSLLLHCDGVDGSTTFIDSSEAGITVTPIAADITTTDPKFGTGCFELTGGNELRIDTPAAGPLDLGAGDFTIEGWTRLDSVAGLQGLFGFGDNAGDNIFRLYVNAGVATVQAAFSGNAWASINNTATLTDDTWFHWAVTRAGKVGKLFLNGVEGTTAALDWDDPQIWGTRLTIGVTTNAGPQFYAGPGAMDEIRITKGAARYTATFIPPSAPFLEVACVEACDPYFAEVSLLVHCDGADGDTTFTDSSANALTITNPSPASLKVTTTNTRFGTGAMLPPAFLSGGLSIPSPNGGPLDIVDGDFTVELWARISAFGPSFEYYPLIDFGYAADGFRLMLQPDTTEGRIVMQPGGGVSWSGLSSGADEFTSGNVWHFVTFTKQGLNLYLFLDGILLATGLVTSTPANNATTTYLGQSPGGGLGYAWSGAIDEVRVTKGVARYTAGFTPPTTPFTDVAC